MHVVAAFAIEKVSFVYAYAHRKESRGVEEQQLRSLLNLMIQKITLGLREMN
jgi:hypothetical protein